jgi:hypothetical protein
MAFTGGPLYLCLLHAAVAITMPSRGTYPTLTYNLEARGCIHSQFEHGWVGDAISERFA